MPPVTPTPPARVQDRHRRRPALALAAACVALLVSGCGTSQPRPILASELAEAQTFPYFRVYWAGPSFDGHPLVAADGLIDYNPKVGDSIYYGNCVQGKGIFGGGSCPLPLQVTTVVYAEHINNSLGPQRNMLIRGVPATVYDEGRSIEIYSGRLAIDVFSDTYAHALQASQQLRPLNAPGSAFGDLPEPVFCPGLYGAVSTALARVLANLPRHACQRAAAQEKYTKEINDQTGSG